MPRVQFTLISFLFATLQSPLVEPVITPRFVITCTDSLLDGLGQLAADYGVKVQVGIIWSGWGIQ